MGCSWLITQGWAHMFTWGQLRRILGAATGKRGPYEFMLTEPARCPTCKHRITEKTLIDREEIGTC